MKLKSRAVDRWLKESIKEAFKAILVEKGLLPGKTGEGTPEEKLAATASLHWDWAAMCWELVFVLFSSFQQSSDYEIRGKCMYLTKIQGHVIIW